MNRLTYLDTLRGLALLMVLAFHYNPLVFAGGYVGVDLFFAISGFVLYFSMHRSYSAGEFLWKRVVRLVPAVWLLCATLLGLSFFLGPQSITLIERALQSALFITPLFDAHGGDYFHSSFSSDALIHMWSVGVEVHMALLLALGLVVVRLFNRRLVPFFFVIGLLSFYFFLTSTFSVSERYTLTPFRIWIFLAGIGLAWLFDKIEHTLWLLPGFALLALGYWFGQMGFITEGAGVAGVAGLMLIAGGRKILAFTPLAHLGRISYGVYLWHLPLLVFIQAGWDPSPVRTGSWITASVVAGALSWFLVEKPSIKLGRRSDTFSSKALLMAGPGFVLCLIAFSALTAPKETSKIQSQDFRECHIFDATQDITTDCFLDTASLMLWGDSHAGVYATPARSTLYQNNPTSLLTRNACPPAGPSLFAQEVSFASQEEELEQCSLTQKEGHIQALRKDTVVMSAHWWRHTKDLGCQEECPFFDQMKEEIDTLKARGVRVILIGPVPEPGWPVLLTQDVRDWTNQPLSTRDRDTLRAERAYIYDWMAAQNVDVVDPFEILCEETTCPAVSADGTPFFFDADHLTPEGAMRVWRTVEALLERDGTTPR